MSWLLGSRYQQPPQDFSGYVQPPASGSGGSGDSNDPPSKKSGAGMDAYRFDSSALERAATAAKQLEKSGKNKFFHIFDINIYVLSFITIIILDYVSSLMNLRLYFRI